jgi:serine/threonine-protein kinase
VVTDFGIAHVDADHGRADAGEMIGTAEFMSPEQAVGAPVDERSDLYALGVVGYYMLSGRLPFQGATATETLAKHLTQSAPALASVAPGLPAPLAHAVDRCLARDPAQRFATGEELAGALAQAVEARRDVPIALRLFIKQNRESTAPIVATEVFSVGSLTVWGTLFAAGIMDPELVLLLAPSSVWLVLGATPVAMLVQMARRLLRSGYDHGDLVRAMRDDLDDRRAELTNTRAAAGDRLRDIVVALETIRVELLRLHAGAASTASVTMDLNAAKILSSDVARMLDGMRDVERLLGRRAAPELGAMPTPA